MTLVASDNGASFQCQGLNPVSGDQNTTDPIIFTVYYPSSEPELKMIPHRTWFNEGDQALLECRLSEVGNPPASLRLMMGEETLYSTEADHLTFDIESFRPADNGAAYHCEAWNHHEAVSLKRSDSDATHLYHEPNVAPLILNTSAISVKVAHGPDHLDIFHESTIVKDMAVVKAGEAVKLRCSVRASHPPPSIQWMSIFNGSIIENSFLAQNVMLSCHFISLNAVVG